jgi:hypothetical protein
LTSIKIDFYSARAESQKSESRKWKEKKSVIASRQAKQSTQSKVKNNVIANCEAGSNPVFIIISIDCFVPPRFARGSSQ